MRFHKSCLFLAAFALSALGLSAQTQILFTFSGTASGDGLGYTDGQAVTFSFLIADNAPVLTADGQNSVTWEDFGVGSQQLIQSITGTGITGTWLAPVNGSDYNSKFYISHSPNEQFYLTTNTFDYNASPVNIGGLQVNGYDVGQIIIQEWGANSLGFGTLPSSGSPVDLLSGMTGSYNVSLSADIYDIGDNNNLSFSITNVTISAMSAVPEPSTYAAIFGALALVGTIYLRRRRGAGLAVA